jgi:molybdate transport system ATP-binding protein
MSLSASIVVDAGDLTLDVELTLPARSTTALVGPNGAGKTTLLRALAGLLPLRAGRIELDGVVLDEPATGTFVPPEQRRVGMVFQDHLLFPHLDAADNVAFGLRTRGMPRRAARAEAEAWLARFDLGGRGSARPGTLSGGQAQRVALARALAPDPALLLLDEPLAALDATTRHEVRRDLRRHLDGFGGVRLLVTHDPVDAAVLAETVVVLDQGRVRQVGTPAEITARPRSPWVAALVGTNLLTGTADGSAQVRLVGGGVLHVAERLPAGPVLAVIHPRTVTLAAHAPDGSARNVWPGRVASIEPLGDRMRVRVDGQPGLVAEVTGAAVAGLGLADGSPVWVSVKATEVDVEPA